jgi:hypothetical protein
MVLVHAGLSEGHCWPLQAAIGGAVGSFLTQGVSACEANISAVLQGRTSFPSAIRLAPSRQRPPQRHGREIGLRGLAEIRPKLPHTNTLARSILRPDLRTNDGVKMHGSTPRGLPTRFRSLGLEGVPKVTRRGHNALDRDCPNIQALGCAPWGMPGRDCLLMRPLIGKYLSRLRKLHQVIAPKEGFEAQLRAARVPITFGMSARGMTSQIHDGRLYRVIEPGHVPGLQSLDNPA